MKILVTGGAGFIGSHLVDEVAARGHSVSVLDDLSTGLRENLPGSIRLSKTDLRSGDLRSLLFAEEPEVVIHLAAQMNVRKSVAGPEADAEVNILGSVRLFQAAADAGVRRIVFASSGGTVYGEHPGRPSLESDLPQPVSPYGIAKLAAEHYGRHLVREFVALRLANVYGPRQNPRGEAGVVALFLHAMLEGRPPLILGDGLQTRDFLWVGDAVAALVRALDGPVGTFNIGTGRETSVDEIYRRLTEITGFQEQPSRLRTHSGDVRRNVLCPDLARERLQWSPTMDLARGLRATAEFFSRRHLDATRRPNGGTIVPHLRTIEGLAASK
jgi:UDP-glucose 4-epimerase